MPDFKLPDGTSIAVPDELTPELGARLRSYVNSMKPPTKAKEWGEMTPEEQQASRNAFEKVIQMPSTLTPEQRQLQYMGVKDPNEWMQGVTPSTRRAIAIESPQAFASAYGFKPEELDPDYLETEYQKFKQASRTPHGATGSFLGGALEGIAKPIRGGVQGLAGLLGNLSGTDSGKKFANINDLSSRWQQDVYDVQKQNHPTLASTGEMVGELPYWFGLGNPAGAGGAFARGAALGLAQPTTSENPLFERLTRGTMGAAGGAAGDVLGTVTAKGTAAVTRRLPQDAAAVQDLIEGNLGIPRQNITALDLRGDKGGKLGSLRTASNLSSVNEANSRTALGALDKIRGQARSTFNGSEFEGIDALSKAAANGDEKAAFLLSQKPDFSANPGPDDYGRAIQFDVKLQQWLGEQNYKPAYDRADSLLPTKPLDTGGLLQRFDAIIAKIKAEGKTARLGKVQKFLEDMRSEIAGSGGKPAVEPTMSWLPEHQAVVDQLLTPDKFGRVSRTPEEIEALLNKQGIFKVQTGGQAAIPGEAPANTLGDLLERRNRLKKEVRYAIEGTPDALTGSEDTRYLTEAKKALSPEIIAGKEAAPEYTKALDEADALYRQHGGPFKEKVVRDLTAGEEGNNLFPSDTLKTVLSLPEDKTRAVLEVLGGKGKAAHQGALAEEIFRGAFDNTKAPGYQFDRGAVLGNINKLRGVLEGSGDTMTSNMLGGLEKALQYMDSLGKTSDVGRGILHGGMMNKTLSLLALNTKGLLTSDSGKAALLALNWARDPEMEGKLLKHVARILQGGGAISGATYGQGEGNPINYPVKQ